MADNDDDDKVAPPNKERPMVDAVKTARIITEEKVVKPLLGGVAAIPTATVEMAQDVVGVTVDAAKAGAHAITDPLHKATKKEDKM